MGGEVVSNSQLQRYTKRHTAHTLKLVIFVLLYICDVSSCILGLYGLMYNLCKHALCFYLNKRLSGALRELEVL